MIPPLIPQLRAFADGRVEVRLQTILPLHVALEIAALAGQHADVAPVLPAANDDDRPSGPLRGVR